VKKQSLQHWILAADLSWILVAMVLAFGLRYGIHGFGPGGKILRQFTPLLIGVVVLWGVLFPAMKLDGFRRGWDLSAIISQLFLGVSFLTLVVLAGSYVAREFVSRLALAYFSLLLFAGFTLVRILAHWLLGAMYHRGAVRRVVIVGNGLVAREVASKIQHHPEMLCRVVGFLCSADASLDQIPGALAAPCAVQTLGVTELFRAHQIDEVIIALSKSGLPEIVNLTASCRREGIGVSVVPYPYELYLSRPQLIDVGGLPLLRLHETEDDFPKASWKRGTDVIFGLLLGVISLPAILTGALLLVHKKGGPFVKELRCGKFGKQFWMLRLNSDRDCGGLPRYETILQQLSITELPQLWNVLRGEMSLVGPRPESPERAKHYSDWQRQRLNIEPGMTGLAQVHGLRQQHSSEEKSRFDLQYMLHPSLFLDISLLLQTMWTLTVRLMRLGKTDAGRAKNENDSTTSLGGRLTGAHSTQSSAD
jgi:lipopolysaccharide/colanic/teichoic acid biosynthesis glycosyltransferase